MKKSFVAILLGLLAATFSVMASEGDRGSADEAIALTKKAIAYLKENGKEKAFAEFNNPNGKFRDRDLYIVVYDVTGVKRAHGANLKMIGKNNLELRDMDGKYLIKDFIKVANGAGKGWVDYRWPNPATKVIESKSTYVEKVDDLVIGCGIYKG